MFVSPSFWPCRLYLHYEPDLTADVLGHLADSMRILRLVTVRVCNIKSSIRVHSPGVKDWVLNRPRNLQQQKSEQVNPLTAGPDYIRF